MWADLCFQSIIDLFPMILTDLQIFELWEFKQKRKAWKCSCKFEKNV